MSAEPFITIRMTPNGLALQSNLTDKLLIYGLLEGAKLSLALQPAQEPQALIMPPNGTSLGKRLHTP